MRILFYSAAVFLVYAFQAVFAALFSHAFIKPDFPLIVVMCLSLLKGEIFGGVSGIINGIIDDAIYGGFMGLMALAKFITGYILGFFTRNVYKGPVIITMMAVFIGSMIYHLSVAALGVLTGTLTNPWYSFFSVSLGSALFNMIISPFVYGIIAKGQRFFDYYFDIKY